PAPPRCALRPARDSAGPPGDPAQVTAVMTTALPLPLHSRGKVRDTYRTSEGELLMVATDRISAFDVVLPTPIPQKGRVLNQLSLAWFAQTADLVRNHLSPDLSVP